MLVLASASPRRRELLSRLCPSFQVVPADVDETLEAVTPEAVARLAERKARAVAAGAGAATVLGADTVVIVDDEPFGKPAGPDEARAMLGRLRGRLHRVVTGLAVVHGATGRAVTAAAVSLVLMARYDDAAIDAYVATGEPLDKAGGYAVQGRGGALVDAVVGSYSNVIGLPLGETARLLRDFGVAAGTLSGVR